MGKGKFTGCIAPFGYMKSPEDKNFLIPDKDTTWIVKKIFAWAAEGHGTNWIRRRLEDEKIPAPCWWNRKKGLRNHVTKWEKEYGEKGIYMWDFSTIKQILENPIYIGTIASQKANHRFKVGWLGNKKPEEWIQVENVHEPLVDRDTYNLVQEKVKMRTCAALALADETKVIEELRKSCQCDSDDERKRMEEKLSESEKRLNELDTLVSKLYEDWIAGRINEANFTRMMEKAQTEQETLQKKADMMRIVLTGRQRSRRIIQNGCH